MIGVLFCFQIAQIGSVTYSIDRENEPVPNSFVASGQIALFVILCGQLLDRLNSASCILVHSLSGYSVNALTIAPTPLPRIGRATNRLSKPTIVARSPGSSSLEYI